MNLLNNIDLYELSHAIGWTLIHSLWQAVAIGGIICLLFRFVSKDNARIRYALSGLGLLLICVASVITLYRYIPTHTSAVVNNFTDQIKSIGFIQQDETFFTRLWTQLQAHLEHTFPYLIKIWMIGMLFLSINLLLKYIHSLKLKKHLTYPLRSDYMAIADRLIEKYNLKQNILFKESGLLDIPSVIGYFKPIVLLPVSMLSGIPENQLEIIIAHELAHIRRHDYLLQFIQGIIELVFFYHPVVWWLSSVVNAEREHICDDLAVKVCGESLTLIKALNNMEAIRKKQYEMVLGFSGKKGKVLNRIKRILRPKNSSNPRRERFMLSGVFTILFAGLILISNFAISGNIDAQKSLFSKINILDKRTDQPEKSFVNESLPIDVVNENSKNDQKKKKTKKEDKTHALTKVNELDEVTEAEEITEVAEVTKVEEVTDVEEATEVEEMQMPPMPPLPPAVAMPFHSFNTQEFNFPKDSVKSDKWVKMKADEIIKEQLEAMKLAEIDMKDVKIDLDVDQMRKELQEGLKDLDFNSAEFQNEMKEQQIEIDKQLKELTDGNFAKQQELQKKEIENHLKEIEESSELNKKEKERIKTELKETVERMNSKEFQDQLKKQLEDAKESLRQHKAKFESGEFENRMKEQRENIKQELKKIESPEYQEKINQQIKESKTKIQEQIKRVNSDQYRKELEESIKKSPKARKGLVPNYHSIGDTGKQPLIILDGERITREQMDQIAPKNIKSINVLKDASAIALYGTQAKNGVILITSKSQDSTTPSRWVRTGYRIPAQKGTAFRSISHEDPTKQPLIILDGKKINHPEMDQISPDKIASISVLKDASASKLYGEEAKNGVILITSKSNDSNVKLTIGDKKNPPLYILDGNKIPAEAATRVNADDIESMNVLKGKEAVRKYGKDAKYGAVEINSKGLKFKDPIKIDNAIYILDGKKISKKESEKINPDNIESINVLKGEHAIEKYGKKGANGVIEITSKIQKSKNEPVIRIKGASINNPLYIVDGKKISAKKAGKINPDDIESIDVLKGEHAIEKYGDEAKNGVVIIKLKTEVTFKASKIIWKGSNDNLPMFIKDGEELSKKEFDAILPSQLNEVRMIKNQSVVKIYGEKAKNGIALLDSNPSNDGVINNVALDPIFIVDGKKVSKKHFETIGPEDIQNLTLFTDNHAIDKYGEEGKDGIFEISLKK